MIEMTRVWERLYLGGRNDAEHLYRANDCGITTVLTLCEEPVLRRNSQLNYLHIPIAESIAIGQGSFDSIIDALAENIRWGTVLLHCGSGLSRTPILAAAWMDVVGYKNLDEALSEIARMRPFIVPSQTLLASVRRFLK